MAECVQMDLDELADYLDANPNCVVLGTYATREECEAQCGVSESSSSGSGIDGVCEHCPGGGPPYFDYQTTNDGMGTFGGGIVWEGQLEAAGVPGTTRSCLWLGTLGDFLLNLIVTSPTTAVLYIAGGGGTAHWNFTAFECCDNFVSTSGVLVIDVPFPGPIGVPPSQVTLTAGPCP